MRPTASSEVMLSHTVLKVSRCQKCCLKILTSVGSHDDELELSLRGITSQGLVCDFRSSSNVGFLVGL